MVDPTGLTIFLIGVALIVVELAQPGYFVGTVGTAALVVGLVQMAWTDFLYSWWSPFVAAAVATVSALASVQFYKKFAPPARAPETLSSDALLGQIGQVVDRVEPLTLKGKVKIGGIVWSADSNETIEPGSDVIVTRVEGVHVVVARAPVPPVPNPNP